MTSPAVVVPQAEELAAAETPFQQVWRAFRRDRLAMVGLSVLVALIALALVGKLLTEWWVVFDPAAVRLPDKLRPPLSTPSAAVPTAQAKAGHRRCVLARASATAPTPTAAAAGGASWTR